MLAGRWLAVAPAGAAATARAAAARAVEPPVVGFRGRPRHEARHRLRAPPATCGLRTCPRCCHRRPARPLGARVHGYRGAHGAWREAVSICQGHWHHHRSSGRPRHRRRWSGCAAVPTAGLRETTSHVRVGIPRGWHRSWPATRCRWATIGGRHVARGASAGAASEHAGPVTARQHPLRGHHASRRHRHRRQCAWPWGVGVPEHVAGAR